MSQLLSDRQQQILGMIIRHYVEAGSPIGSRTLVEDYGMEVSSATIRNEMATLTEQGYITQLHTSAGRIPTEKGYRYFVQRLIGEFELPAEERHMIRHQFHQARLDIDQWMRLAVAILARASASASIVTAPKAYQNRYKHLQLISTQGRLVLMILVLFGGDIKQQMLSLAEPISQNQLSAAAEKLNQLFDGCTLDDIRGRAHLTNTELEKDVTHLLIDTLERMDSRKISEVYRDGLVNILENDNVRQAVRVLEERTFLASLLSETLHPGVSGVQVVIGGDGRWEELKDCTVILSRYGVSEELSGTLAVFGPTRMAYSRNISAVRYVANLMSNLVQDYYMDLPQLSGSKLDEVIDQ